MEDSFKKHTMKTNTWLHKGKKNLQACETPPFKQTETNIYVNEWYGQDTNCYLGVKSIILQGHPSNNTGRLGVFLPILADELEFTIQESDLWIH